MRKRFECGHVGRGNACRRCLNADDLVVRAGKLNGEQEARTRLEAARLYATSSPTQSDFERAGFREKQARRLLIWTQNGVIVNSFELRRLVYDT